MAYYSSMSAALADGLLRYWDFDDQSFTIVDRASGFNGSVYLGGLSPQPTDPIPFFKSYLFGYVFDTSTQIPDGTINPEYDFLTPVEIPRETGAPILSAFSIRIRFRFDGLLDGQSEAVIFNNIPDDIYQTIRLFIDSSNQLNIILPPFYGTNTLGAVTTGAWHEIIISNEDDYFYIYLDGSYIYGGGANGTDFTLDAPISVAAPDSSNLTDAFNGRVDEFAIWNRRFQLADSQAIRNSGDGQALVARPINAELDVVVPLAFDFWVGDPFPEVTIVSDVPIIWDVRAYQDWTANLPLVQLQEIYTLTIRSDGEDPLTVPISSWQATDQAEGRQKYVQAVVPAAIGLAEALETRVNGTLAISKGYRFDDGSTQMEEIVTAALETIRPDRGIRSYSLTLSGYADGDPVSTGSRTLTGVRQISISNGKPRVRCDIDLFLRPGMTVTADDTVFRADYINYYVGPNQKFCEVAER